ncbi:ABC transporter permease subunit, partial [Pseudomonas sp. NPDC089554]|uniref:ABC transporter permease subunit n=1 Tax=Pseudomonas sp. NPDC089554 TaxID=3390653 RepID=UPI003D03FE6E
LGRRRLWTLLNPKVKKRLQSLAEEMGDKQPFAPYVLIEAIGARDYPVVQNGILLIACLVILVNFVVDILYGLANPRIRHQR